LDLVLGVAISRHVVPKDEMVSLLLALLVLVGQVDEAAVMQQRFIWGFTSVVHFELLQLAKYIILAKVAGSSDKQK
jgi:hypothetical protein